MNSLSPRAYVKGLQESFRRWAFRNRLLEMCLKWDVWSKVCPECCMLSILSRKEATHGEGRMMIKEGTGRTKWLATGCRGGTARIQRVPCRMLHLNGWPTRNRCEDVRLDTAEGSRSQFRRALKLIEDLSSCLALHFPSTNKGRTASATQSHRHDALPTAQGRETME